MSKSLGRLCLGAGFLMYVASLWLTAVGGPGVGTIKPPSIADLAIDSWQRFGQEKVKEQSAYEESHQPAGFYSCAVLWSCLADSKVGVLVRQNPIQYLIPHECS